MPEETDRQRLPRVAGRGLLVLLLVLLAAPSVEAQYRGGRRPPKPPLQRKGLLYVEAGWFSATPGQDFASPTGGAAGEGTGLRTATGIWFSPRVTIGFELSLYTAPRLSDTVPYDLLSYDNVTSMEFVVGGWQLQSRYHLNIRKRFMPFVVLGVGRVTPTFTINYTFDDRNRSAERRKHGFIYAGGVGADIVLGNHSTITVEWRWMTWFGDWFIPGARYWTSSRLGAGLAWHF